MWLFGQSVLLSSTSTLDEANLTGVFNRLPHLCNIAYAWRAIIRSLCYIIQNAKNIYIKIQEINKTAFRQSS